MTRWLRNFIDGLGFLIQVLIASLALGLVVIVLLQVFYRYVINSSLAWPEELSIVLFIWMGFLGASILAKDWEHVSITLVIDVFSNRTRLMILIAIKIICIVFLLVLCYFGFILVNGSFHAILTSVGISSKWGKLAIPVSALLMTIFILDSVTEDMSRFFRSGAKDPKEPN